MQIKKVKPDAMGKKRGTNRRDFLKLGGLSVAVAAGTLVAGKTFSQVEQKTSRRLAMVIDLRRCIGCQACSVACKAEFDVPLGVWRSWVKSVERGTYPNVKRSFLPRLCNQCTDPPCVSVCPTKASYIDDDNTIQIREERCIGCRLCVSGCPYNSRFNNPIEHTAQKCTFCIHRVRKGVVPACVNTCEAKARTFGDLNDPKSDVAKLINTHPVQTLKDELGTQPNVYYINADEDVMGGSLEIGRASCRERV